MNKFTIILLGFCVIFSACSSAPKKTTVDAEQKASPSYLKLQIYGNWCGLDYPKNFELLSTPPPAIDALDDACKRHDYCYIAKGQFSCECDQTIVQEINQALLLENINGNTRHVARSIRTHFQGSPCEGDSRTKALPSHLLHRVYHNVKGAVGGLVNKVWPSENDNDEPTASEDKAASEVDQPETARPINKTSLESEESTHPVNP